MNLQRLSPWQIDLIGVSLCAALLAGFYFGALAPLLREREAAAARHAQIDRERRKTSSVAASVRKLQSQLDAVHFELSANPLRLEESRHVNDRLARIAALAGAHNIQIRDMQPGRSALGPRYETLPIHLSGTGHYGDCVRFLHELREQLRDTGVSSLSLSGNPEEPGTVAAFHFDLLWYAALPGEASAR